jgi:uncharacterized protein
MANWGKILSRGNVEDRRSIAPAALGGISLTSVALLFLFNYLAGGNLSDALNQIQQLPIQQQYSTDTHNSAYDGADSYEVFASTVLGSNNDMWSAKFAALHKEYVPPKLVLFRSATQSGCGTATSEVGPHYCPIDQTIYLDETFFDVLTKRLGAEGGDVAQAYVISHEVGHHIQQALGTMDTVQTNADGISLELQADCFAGMWANSIKDQSILEPGEIREAMDAAAAVGDDRIQERVNGYVNPETWTHGSSAQRQQWFNQGYNAGSLEACNTFR